MAETVKKSSGKVALIIIGVLSLCGCCAISVATVLLLNATSSTGGGGSLNRPAEVNEQFDTNRNGWLIEDADTQYATTEREISGGAYRWRITPKVSRELTTYATTTVALGKVYGVSVDVAQKSGSDSSTSMLLFGYTSPSNFHAVRLNSKYQQYSIGYLKEGVWKTVVPWTRTSKVAYQDGTNTLSVLVRADSYEVFVNGQSMFASTRENLSEGGVAIAVQTYESGVENLFAFDNFLYRKE